MGTKGHTDHSGHEHFVCACGEVFHSEEELEQHKKDVHGK